MKEFLQTLFKSTEDRIKNPFIGAFLTSWILFNWKPILFLIFSSENIKEKIIYISDNYTDIWCYFLLPLLSAIFYIGILPYVNLGFEWLVKFSISRRNNVSLETRKANLELQIEVAQNEIIIEEAKTTFRERNSHNMMVENLQNQIAALSLSLEEANYNLVNISTLNIEQKNELNQTITTVKNELKEQANRLNNIISDEKSKYRELLDNYTNDKNILAKYEFTIADLTDDLTLEKFRFDRFKDQNNKIIAIGNLVLLEFFILDNIVYFDIVNKEIYDIKYVAALSVTNNIKNQHNDRTTIIQLESELLSKFPDPNKMLNNYRM